MRGRIAPLNTRPEHIVEIGYLRDLTIAIKWDYYGLGGRSDVPPLSIETLGLWQAHRRDLVGCHNFKSLTLNPRLPEHGIHEKEITVVDNVLAKIGRGLLERKPTGYIDSDDILALEKAYRALGGCQSKLVYY
jgi:hypothetical protein